MDRFYDSSGSVLLCLSPLELKRQGFTNKWKAIFQLMSPIRFKSDIAGGDIVVPVGFMSDFASIPKVAWAIFMSPDDPRIALGSIVHDWLYGNIGNIPVLGAGNDRITLTRDQCDRILAYEAMNELGATKIQQDSVYKLLHLFGGAAFNTDPPQIRWKFAQVGKPVIRG